MKELRNRIIQDNMDIIRGCKKMHTIDDMDALDEVVYNDINNIKLELMKDNLVRKSLFTQIIEALDNNELELASELQLIMKDKMRLAGKFMRKEEQEVTECHQTSSGLYQPEYEHDACGVGMIVDIHGDLCI